MRIHSLYVTVKDMDRAITFWSDVLEKKPSHEDKRFSYFEIEGFGLGLYNPAVDGETRSVGNNCVPVFATNNLDKEVERLQKMNVRFIGEITDVGGGIRLIQFVDSEENVIELEEGAP